VTKGAGVRRSYPDPPSDLNEPQPRRAAPLDGLSDGVLLRALAGGRGHAFDLLVARHGPRVRSYVGQLVGDRAQAEDLTQDVFVKLLTGIGAFDPDRGLVVWLLRVARNEALDHLRRAKLHQRLVARARAGVGRLARRARRQPIRPDEELERREFYLALERALAGLPEAQRSVFLLRERGGLSYGEIGEVMDCSPKTVSTRLHRARSALREVLGEHLEDGP
jgi:RNA polymerase sigma-70 factor, ECF subfamily